MVGWINRKLVELNTWQEESEALRIVCKALKRDKENLAKQLNDTESELKRFAEECVMCGVWFEKGTKCDCDPRDLV
jgi:hypothetical protein